MYVITEEKLYSDGENFTKIETVTFTFKTAVKIINKKDIFALRYIKTYDSYKQERYKINDIYLMDDNAIKYDLISGIGFMLREIWFKNKETNDILKVRYYIRKTGLKF